MPSASRTKTKVPVQLPQRPSSQPQSGRRTVIERMNEAVPNGAPEPTSATNSASDPFKGRSFRLDVVNAAEDIPRLVRAFVKVGGIECALVLRPQDGQGLLIHSQDGQAWKWVGIDSDVPARPEDPLAPRDALALLKGAQTQMSAQGHISLRGLWSGKLSCDRGHPRITLQRKVASYGTLIIWSDAPARLWYWRVERAQKWFTRAGQMEGNAQTLVVAIQQGLASAMGLLGEACSVRDSRRRAALDSEYAEVHPIKPAREGKDPTEKFKPKEPKPLKAASSRGRKAAAPASAAPASVAPQPTGQPTTLPEPKTRRPRPPRMPENTPMPIPASATSSPAAPDLPIDPAMDKALLEAFGNMLTQTMASMG